MITKLTPSQEKQIPIYRDKWLAKGLSTDRIDRKQAITDFTIFNRLVLGYKKQPVVIFMDSPLTTWMATVMVYSWLHPKESQVGSQVRSQVASQVWSQVGSQVWSQVESQVWSQVGSQVWSQVESQVWSQVRSQVGSFVYPYLGGNFDSGYFGFFEFCNKVLGVKFTQQENWDCYLKTANVSLIYPFEDFCVISEKPVDIKIKNMVLHNDKGAAVLYADGFSVYSLNGVMVTKELVETPADKLDPQIILKETNAEIRREIVRKIGVERLVQKLGAKTLDKKGSYELLNIDLGENRIRPYLKMLNPSVGTYHIEGVSPECRTIEQALNWRNQTTEAPEVLT
jgi:hypothetical protein